MVRDYFILAFSNLRHKGLRSWLTILGIFIGITSVVALISLGNGLKTAVNSQFGIGSTEVITVQGGGLNSFGPPGSGTVKPLTIEDVDAIEGLSVVRRAIRRNLPPGKLEFNDKVVFGMTTNILDGEDREFIHEQIELEVETGRALKDGDGKKVFLGYNFYVDKVGLDKPVKPGNKVLIQDESFEVVGIGKRKGSFIFDNIVYMNDRALNDLMDYGDNVDIIAVQVKDKDLMEKAKEDIEKLLRKRRDVDKGEEDFEISTPEAALETVNQVLTGVQIFVALVAFISIFVGAIGIVNTMTTSVLERRKEIGVMKAIGARNEQIFALFFIESGLMGLIGGILGVGIGLLIGMGGTNAINNLLGATASMTFNIPLIVSTLVGSFLVGSIAGIAPAMQAARQHPVDALRG